MTTATQPAAPVAPPLPEVCMFPLAPGPCVYYERGIRVGEPKPATMLRRMTPNLIHIVDVRGGENFPVQNAIRHVDDPALNEHRGERRNGAWDYCKGLRYSWIVPGYITESPDQKIPLPVVRAVAHLHNEGLRPGEIALKLAQDGLTKEYVQALIAKLSR